MTRRTWAATGVMVGGLTLLILLCGAVWAWEVRRLPSALEQAKHDLAEGRIARARQQFTELGAFWSANGEVPYQLGLCQQARGQANLALAAWEQVPPTSPFAGWATARRARVQRSRGRLAESEALLVQSLKIPGTHRDAPRLVCAT
jgi:hypothetical protein